VKAVHGIDAPDGSWSSSFYPISKNGKKKEKNPPMIPIADPLTDNCTEAVLLGWLPHYAEVTNDMRQANVGG